jgi:antitoxin HigA-1
MPTKSKSSITTDLLPNPHPGEILMEEFLKPMSLSQTALANAVHVPPRRINEIVLGRRAITADTDLRLSRYFGMSEGFFLGLQTDYVAHGPPPPNRRSAQGDQAQAGVA